MGKSNTVWGRFKRITPASGMREYVSSGGFVVLMLAALLFAMLRQRVITTELENGIGGIWCRMGVPAILCLVISAALACFGAKTKLLPSVVSIAGLGGMEISIVMFFVIGIRRLRMAGNILGTIQEISMLAYLAAWFVCILLLMMTGIGIKAVPAAGTAAAVVSVIALAFFVIRVMYIFSSLIPALSRNLVMEDGRMAVEVEWVLRSVAPGTDAVQSVYNSRLLDSIGTALLMVASIPLAVTYHSHFSEQAVMLRNSRDIPLPTQQRRVYTGYDDYTAAPLPSPEEEFNVTRDGYYVEKKEQERPKFNRRERTASEERGKTSSGTTKEEPVRYREAEQPEIYDPEKDTSIETFDHYVPGEGWMNFNARVAKEREEDHPEEPSEPAVRKKVVPVQAVRAIPDPNDPDFWNQYRK